MKRLTKLIISLTMLFLMTFSLTACNKSVVVTFDATGGVVSSITAEFKTNENYTLPTPVKEGYNFVCWIAGEKEIPNQGVWSINKDVTLKAKWSVKNYDITFDANLGELDVTSMNVVYDSEINLPVPTRLGYAFKGWEYKGKILSDSVWKIDGENIELKAQWKIIDYTVTFELNGGQFSDGYENMETTTVNFGKDYDFSKFKPIKPSSPTAEFKCWKLDDKDGTIVTSIGKWKYAENVKLIAVWKDFWSDELPA